jgi:hypothetical protein
MGVLSGAGVAVGSIHVDRQAGRRGVMVVPRLAHARPDAPGQPRRPAVIRRARVTQRARGDLPGV